MIADAERAAAVALVGLPKIGPARYRALIEHAGGTEAAWAAVRSGRLDGVDLRAGGRHGTLVDELRSAASRVDPADELDRHRGAGAHVLLPDDPGWPASLVDDPEPPLVLFARGDLDLLQSTSVAVVGTRRCTAVGARLAGGIGADLAGAGVPVVSGLALGIDGAAHRGALGGGGHPIGVVASGLDVVYPLRHRSLWEQVASNGVLVSESPLGRPPERWRFPARNRIIAALAEVVVVVESRRRGGSMSTVEAALDRGRTVLAVPGSVAAEQSAGTNQLLSEGAGMARDAADVLAALGLDAPVPGRAGWAAGRSRHAAEPLDGPLRKVAAVLCPAPAGVEHLAAESGLPVPAVLTALAHLEAAGLARRAPGGYEQVVR